MQKGKTWQRVASAVLAVMMTMSTQLWGRSRFFNDETQKNRKRHALRG